MGMTDYIRVMERMGYAHDLNNATSKQFETIWMHLASPNTNPELDDHESVKVHPKRLLTFLCLMHRFTNNDNSIASIKVSLKS